MFSLEGLAVGVASCVHRSAEDCWRAAVDRAQHAILGILLDAFVFFVALFVSLRRLAGMTLFVWHVQLDKDTTSRRNIEKSSLNSALLLRSLRKAAALSPSNTRGLMRSSLQLQVVAQGWQRY